MNDERSEASLKRIEDRVTRIDDKVDRLLIGGRGEEGLISRVARIEDRQSSVGTLCAWLAASFAALGAVVLPSWFRSQQ